MKKVFIIAGILALVLCVIVLAGASEVVLAQDHGCGHNGKGFWSSMTDEQREAIQEKIKEMRDRDVSPEEIHTAVAEMLKGYGIEVPELKDCAGPPDGGGFGPGGFLKNLTEEQREAVRTKIKEMRDQGAKREEIHSAVVGMLKGYGIEVPEKWDKGHEFHPFGPGRGGFGANLTDEQRQAIQEKIKGMRDQGAKREEIHAAVTEMLKGYGIQVPEDWGGPHGMRDFGPGPGGFWKDLTKEQREAVREKIKEMRSQSATREEIRSAVAEMIKGFGIQSPQDSGSVSSGTTSAVPNIIAQSYPNPFNPETEISFTLPENSYVSVTIFNIQGQKVKRLVNEYQSAGTRKVVWDGRDENGEGVASGIYFYRIEAGSQTVTNRMVLLK